MNDDFAIDVLFWEADNFSSLTCTSCHATAQVWAPGGTRMIRGIETAARLQFSLVCPTCGEPRWFDAAAAGLLSPERASLPPDARPLTA